LLTSQSPEALRELNRGRLQEMAVDKDVIGAFTDNK
jgi:hypothetical protein